MKLRHLSYDSAELDSLLDATHGNPFAFLGPHQVHEDWMVRVFAPHTREVALVDPLNPANVLAEADKVDDRGFFEAILPGATRRPEYRLRFTDFDGGETTLADPYSFGPILGELDLHLFAEGNHHRLYDRLGAHLKEVGGVRGCAFAVWAPNARRVSVVGYFNVWDWRVFYMF